MWAAFAVFFLEAFAFASWLPRLPEIKRAFALSEGDLGLVLLALPLGNLVAIPLAGWASTRLSIRRLNALGMAWMTGTITLVGLAPSVGVLVPVLLAVGLGTGTMGVAMNAAGFDAERRIGRPVLSRCHAMFSLGLAGGGLAAGLFLEASVPIVWHLLSVNLALLLVFALALRSVSSATPVPNVGADEGEGAGAGPRFALPTGPLLAPALIAFGALLAEGAALDWSSVFLRTVLDAEGASVAAGVTVFAGAMALARFGGDAIAERFGTRALAAGGAVVAAADYAVLAGSPNTGTAFAGLVLAGLGLAPVVPLVFRAGAVLSPAAPGLGVAAVSSLGYAGFLLGPALMGLVAEATSLRWSFAIVAALMAAVPALARGLADPQRPSSAPARPS